MGNVLKIITEGNTVGNFAKTVVDIKTLASGSTQVLNKTVSDSKSRVPALVRKNVAKKYNINPKEINPDSTHIVDGKKVPVKQAGSIRISGDSLSTLQFEYKGRLLTPTATRFSMTPKAPNKEKQEHYAKVPGAKIAFEKSGSSVAAIKPRVPTDITVTIFKGKTKLLTRQSDNKVFLAPTRGKNPQFIPFIRRSDDRNSINVVKTLSMPQMITNEEVAGNINTGITNLIDKRIKHHAKRLLGMEID